MSGRETWQEIRTRADAIDDARMEVPEDRRENAPPYAHAALGLLVEELDLGPGVDRQWLYFVLLEMHQEAFARGRIGTRPAPAAGEADDREDIWLTVSRNELATIREALDHWGADGDGSPGFAEHDARVRGLRDQLLAATDASEG